MLLEQDNPHPKPWRVEWGADIVHIIAYLERPVNLHGRLEEANEKTAALLMGMRAIALVMRRRLHGLRVCE